MAEFVFTVLGFIFAIISFCNWLLNHQPFDTSYPLALAFFCVFVGAFIKFDE